MLVDICCETSHIFARGVAVTGSSVQQSTSWAWHSWHSFRIVFFPRQTCTLSAQCVFATYCGSVSWKIALFASEMIFHVAAVAVMPALHSVAGVVAHYKWLIRPWQLVPAACVPYMLLPAALHVLCAGSIQVSSWLCLAWKHVECMAIYSYLLG